MFPLAIFLGAFTLFFLQPLMGKVLMPGLGGGAAVWVTCLVFYQSLLLIGYLLAHGITRLHPRFQWRAWAGLAAGAALSVLLTFRASGTPLLPAPAWAADATAAPALTLLLVLARSIGLPFLLLASASPLIQAWSARRHPDRSPFRLYALSNAGSFLGLLAYPFVAEPLLGTRSQAWFVALMMALFILTLGAAAWQARGGDLPPTPPAPRTRDDGWAWLLGAASGTLLLVAVSNLIGSNLVSTSMVWVVPLGLYLLSFVIVFEARWDLGRPWPFSLLCLGMGLGLVLLMRGDIYTRPALAILATGLTVLGGCCLCHGWLYSRRPAPERLTRFYLVLAAGGALGGWLGALAAPLVFSDIHEFPVAVCLSALCGLLWLRQQGTAWVRPAALGAVLLLGLGTIVRSTRQEGRTYRDFFGVSRVVESHGLRRLMHGATSHGMEVLQYPEWPLTYYGPRSGLGQAMAAARQRKPSLKIGVVGLGVGSTAAYARPGDQLDLYEISPVVLRLAGPEAQAFQRVRRSGAQVRAVLGDARTTLEAERSRGSNGFDVLSVDAFLGGQIPWHLLTVEALDLYLSHLSEAGILVIHASSHMAIDRMLAAQARRMGLWALGIYHPSSENPGKTHPLETGSIHILMSRTPVCADGNLFRVARWAAIPPVTDIAIGPRGQLKVEHGRKLAQGMRVWTDDRNSLGGLMRATPSWELPAR